MSESLQLHLYRLEVGRSSLGGGDGPLTVLKADNGLSIGEVFGETIEETQRVARQIVARWNAVEDALEVLNETAADEMDEADHAARAREILRRAL